MLTLPEALDDWRPTPTCAAANTITGPTRRPMMTQPLLDTLRHLKLIGMHDALAHQLTQPDTYDLPFEDRLGMLLDREVLHRDNRRLDRLLKAAKLRVTTCVEDIDYRHPRGLELGRMAPLASCEWIG